MEHRRRLEDDRAGDHEAKGREVQHRPSRPELANQQQQQEHRPDRGQRVDHLSDPLGMLEAELLAEQDPHTADGEEPRWGVVAPGRVGKLAVLGEEIGVVERLLRVVAGDRRIDERVSDRDDRDQDDDRGDSRGLEAGARAPHARGSGRSVPSPSGARQTSEKKRVM